MSEMTRKCLPSLRAVMSPARKIGGISFMWFIKSELRKQIDKYDKDKDVLLEFARIVHKPRIEEITLEDIKSYYRAVIEPKNSLHERNRHMLAIRKFFKEHRGGNVLNWREITDEPLKCVEQNAIILPMKKETKRPQGRPIDWASVKKVMKFRENEENGEAISFRTIGVAMKKDPSQIYKWYLIGKKKSVDLSTG